MLFLTVTTASLLCNKDDCDCKTVAIILKRSMHHCHCRKFIALVLTFSRWQAQMMTSLFMIEENVSKITLLHQCHDEKPLWLTLCIAAKHINDSALPVSSLYTAACQLTTSSSRDKENDSASTFLYVRRSHATQVKQDAVSSNDSYSGCFLSMLILT